VPVVDRNQEARARRLKRLALIAEGLRSAAALSPNDPELQARVNAAGTACQQLVAYLRRQEVEQLTAERTAALAEMRQAGQDMEKFNAACSREALLATRIRQLRAEVRHG
jgi:hypothetical protein